jgi:hypothetical protein
MLAKKGILGILLLLVLMTSVMASVALAEGENVSSATFSADQGWSQSPVITVSIFDLPSVDGVQVNVQHEDYLEITNPSCTGLFAGAMIIGPVSTQGGSLIACQLIGKDTADQASGSVMEFEVSVAIGSPGAKRANLSFGEGGPWGTMFAQDGQEISVGDLTNTQNLLVWYTYIYPY